jgi:uncharacterized protein YhfF
MRRAGAALAAALVWAVGAQASAAGSADATTRTEASDGDAARAAWTRCAATLGVPAAGPVRVRRFGETRAVTERILPLVLSGEKTITTTTPWLDDSDPEQKPAEGAFSVVVDADARPVAVLRTTNVRTLAFEAVTEDDTRYEGKPVRPLAAWREVHVRFFDRVLKPVGKAWTPGMPVTLERFEVVCREPAKPSADDPATTRG